MTVLLKSEIIKGNEGKLLLKSATTRAEMAQVLYNILAEKK